MRIKKQFSRILGLCLIIGSLANVCSGQIYRESVRVLAVENRYALVQLGFDVSDALDMQYVVFDSTSADFDNNIVYVWHDSINDWVKTTIPAFLDGSLFYNMTVKDVIVITDSLNAIQKFGENANWAPEMFVIDQLDFPSILNSINEKYDFTAAQWNVFSTKYNVKVENVATNKSRYAQPLWDFSLPAFTVEARENSANSNLQAKDIQESSVEVVIIDTELLETPTPVETHVDEPVVLVEESNIVVVQPVEVTPIVEETVVEETIVVVKEIVVFSTNVSVIVEEPVVDSATTNGAVVIEEVQEVVETKTVEIIEKTVVEAKVVVVVETNAPAVPPPTVSVSSQVVKPSAPVVVVEEATEVVIETITVEEVEKVITEAPEVDSNINQVELEL